VVILALEDAAQSTSSSTPKPRTIGIMENKVQSKFDEIARAYDSQRRRIIPCYDDFYGLATFFAEAKTDRPKC
jgi:hypothetical protein